MHQISEAVDGKRFLITVVLTYSRRAISILSRLVIFGLAGVAVDQFTDFILLPYLLEQRELAPLQNWLHHYPQKI
jgi:hypothetical protein